MTDEAPVYRKIGEEFAGHGTVNHSAEEYVRAYFWHTNTVEDISDPEARHLGVYHHVSAQHLHRYLANLTFATMSASAGVDDAERMARAVKGARETANLSANWSGPRQARKPKRPSLTWAIVWTEAAMLPGWHLPP